MVSLEFLWCIHKQLHKQKNDLLCYSFFSFKIPPYHKRNKSNETGVIRKRKIGMEPKKKYQKIPKWLSLIFFGCAQTWFQNESKNILLYNGVLCKIFTCGKK